MPNITDFLYHILRKNSALFLYMEQEISCIAQTANNRQAKAACDFFGKVCSKDWKKHLPQHSKVVTVHSMGWSLVFECAV
jgi:hypothetical protein